jgi:UrcA family protein
VIQTTDKSRNRSDTDSSFTIEESFMRKSFIAALACGAFIFIAPPAFAQPPAASERQVVVHFGDLDMSREQDARTFLSRLEGAAQTACNTNADMKELPWGATYNSCVDDSMKRAVASVYMPLVSRLFEHRIPEIVARK